MDDKLEQFEMGDRKKSIFAKEHSRTRYEWVRTRIYEPPILDVGCGEGWITSAIPFDVLALDTHEEGYCKASNAKYIKGSIYDIPFSDGYFGTVCAFEVLEHLEDPDSAIKELFRVCGGLLYVTVPSFGAMTNTPGHIQDFEDIGIHIEKGGFEVIDKYVLPPYSYVEAKKPKE